MVPGEEAFRFRHILIRDAAYQAIPKERRAQLHETFARERLSEAGETFEPNILAYMNRLSDLLWLFGRKLEVDAGVSSSLRKLNDKDGPRWSRAW